MAHINTHRLTQKDIDPDIKKYIATLQMCKEKYAKSVHWFFFLRKYTNETIQDILTSSCSRGGTIPDFRREIYKLHHHYYSKEIKRLDLQLTDHPSAGETSEADIQRIHDWLDMLDKLV